MDIDRVKSCLTGPVMSMRTAFDRSGDIDFPAVQKIVETGIEGGTQSIMLTVGDSHFDCLSDAEIGTLTEATVRQTADRALVIAADRYHSTDRAVTFARSCRELGAGMFMALPPDWAHSCTPRSLADHYATIARELPVMIVTNRFIPRGPAFGLETIERALDLSDRIVAIKDDMGGVFAQDLCMRFNQRVAIIAGGQKRNHLNLHPYGCCGYLSTFAMFNPTFAADYWHRIVNDDLKGAAAMIAEKDAPFFQFLQSVEGGFDAAMHGMIELYGLGQRHRRKPYHTMTDDALAELESFLVRLDLLKDSALG